MVIEKMFSVPQNILEEVSPHPDIHVLFEHYNNIYFDNDLGACSVEWSTPRMTRYVLRD
jgi:hypothetical protein